MIGWRTRVLPALAVLALVVPWGVPAVAQNVPASGTNAAKAQYVPTPTPTPPTPPMPPTPTPTPACVQCDRQHLPHTGWWLVPVALGGLGLLSVGLALRRRA